MINGEQARELMLTIIGVQTTFRQAIQRRLKAHGIDLTFEMLQILASLWRQDGMNQQELAARNFKDKASLTSLLNNLEKKGLVMRMENKADRRNKNIFLTEKGLDYSGKVKPVLYEIYTNTEAELNKKETENFINYLAELNDVFKKQ